MPAESPWRDPIRLCAIAIALCIALMSSAGTAEAATLSLSAMDITSYEDNLFRLPKASQATLSDPSDVSNTISLIGTLTTTSAPVVLSAQGALARTLFLANRDLNSTEYNVTGRAYYKAGSGELTLDLGRARRASSFEDLRVGARSIQTVTVAHAEGNRTLASGISLFGDGIVSTNRNSNFAASSGDNRRVDVTGGIGYISPTGNILALEGRRSMSRGLRDRILALGGAPILYRADFDEDSANLRIEWARPELWSVSARIGYARHRDLSGIASNFRGIIGKGTFAWTPTPFITATLAAERSFSPDQSPFANGIKVTSYGGNLVLKPADAVQLGVSYGYRQRVFRYDLQAGDPVAAARIERLSTIGITADYTLASKVQISLAIEHRQRDSNIALAMYKGTGATVTIRIPLTR